MKNNQKLLKNINSFYKLALFVDKDQFLKSISQANLGSFVKDETFIGLSNSLNNAIQNWIKQYGVKVLDTPIKGMPPQKTNVVSFLLNNKSFDINTLPKMVESAQKAAMVSDLKDLGSDAVKAWFDTISPVALHILEAAKKQLGLLNNWVESNEHKEETLPVETIINDKTEAKYPSIPKETQTFLNALLVPPGLIMPLKTDGLLGTETTKALKAYRSKYNDTSKSKTELYNAIKNTYMNENKGSV